jgi:hypothetical protein
MAEHSERCAQIGSRLVVVATDRAVLRPIQITGLDELLKIVPTVQDAACQRDLTRSIADVRAQGGSLGSLVGVRSSG